MTIHTPTALAAAKACQLAYTAPNCWGGNGQGRVECNPATGSLSVSIAGTNGKRDAYQDAQFWQVDRGQGAFVHGGFFDHWARLKPDIMAEILRHPAGEHGVSIQGHSLGAAAVVLMIYDSPGLFAGSIVHLFGCPRVGNANFAAIFDRMCRDACITVFRIVSRGDPVATVKLPGDWSHVGREVQIGMAGDREPDHPIREYIAALESML